MHRSLSARLSFWIVLAAALLSFGLILYLARVWRSGIREEVDKDAMQVLDNAVFQLDDILDDVERTANVLSWFVIRDLNKPDMMVPHSNNALRYHPKLNSCSISFEPGFFPEKGTYYSIFSWRKDNGTIVWEQEGDDQNRYYEKYWYQLPKQLRHECWTDPYSDIVDFDDPAMNTGMLVSFCIPFFKADSTFAGSISLDLALQELSEELHNVRPYENAYCVLVAKDGTYLIHPDASKLMYHTIFNDAEELSLPELKGLGEAMARQEEGMRVIPLDGQRYYVYFQPVPTTEWSFAIFCPESDIYGGYNRLQHTMIEALLIGLLLLFFVLIWVIRRQLAPLGKLAEKADQIASGNFDRPLPPDTRKDEIGQLNRSFGNMQASLVKHIRELTESTASRERMERELQIARNIQMGMVPHEFDLGPGIDLYASMTPAREVGGDLYDFFVQDDTLYLCIGDVSGKGVPASLFMSVARAMFRIVARQGLAPAEIARRINDTVAEKNDQMIFVTMFIAAVNLKTGEMDYCNCGHNAPVLLDERQKPVFLDCQPNTAIGILPDFSYEGQQVADLHGKVLFLYTDGLNEAENTAHEQFGNDRMLATLAGAPFQDARTLVDRLSTTIAAHVGNADPSDDLTMLCLKIA